MSDFREFMGYAAIGLIAAAIALAVSFRSRGGRRAALALLGLAVVYPLGIVFFFNTRTAYGESYGWIVMGVGWGILLAGIAGLLLLGWIVCLIVHHFWLHRGRDESGGEKV